MSNSPDILENIKECFIKLEGPDRIKELTMKALDSGVEASQLITAIKEGLDEVGQKYENSEYFLSDLVMSGVMASEVTNLVKPRLQSADSEPIGKVLLGTVKGDIHDIGKSLVASMLSMAGFEVIDLGVDVSPDKFVEAVKEHTPEIIGLSALLTTTLPIQRETIRALEENNLRGQVKVIIGGSPVTEDWVREIGADGYGEDAIEAVKVVKRILDISE